MSVKSSSSRNRAIIRYNTGESEATTSSDDTNGSANQRKGRPTNKSDHQTDDHNIDRMVSDCVKYLLVIDQKKLPIKRIDIVKNLFKQNLSRKTVEEIIEKARTQLQQFFAIDLLECPQASNLSYILVNKLPAEGLKQAIDSHSIPDKQLIQTALLTPVLAVIFMSGDSVNEEVIWKFIHKLGFDPNSKSKTIDIDYEANGITVKKLLTELWVRQLYLKYQKISGSDPIGHEFKWGFRAEKEFSKMDVLKFVCDMFADGVEPKSWRTQYTAAQHETQTDAQNEPDIEVIA